MSPQKIILLHNADKEISRDILRLIKKYEYLRVYLYVHTSVAARKNGQGLINLARWILFIIALTNTQAYNI